MDPVYKNYNIEREGTFAYFRNRSKAQGQAPKALGGAYTTRPLAMRAIDAYVGSKGKKDGATKASN